MPPRSTSQDGAPAADEQEALARLEATIRIVEMAHARLAADRRRTEPDPAYREAERRMFHRDRRLTEALTQMQQAALQSRAMLRVLYQKRFRARLAAGSRTTHLLSRIIMTKRS